MNVKKFLTLLPGMLTVGVVGVSAAFLVTHPPQPMAQTAAPNPARPASPPAAPGGTVQPATPAPPAPANATPLSGSNPSTSVTPPPAPEPNAPPPPAPAAPPPAPATPAPEPNAPPPAPATPPPTPVKPAPAAGTPPAPQISPTTSAGQHGYRVQAGVFRNRVYAEDLMRQLRDKGYNVTLAQGSLLHVYVGPATSRADAERLVAKLHSGGFEAIVVSTQ